MKTAILMLLACIGGLNAFSQSKQTKKMETIVLVHGAWSGASAWQAVIPLLKEKGHEVIAVNLPAHGADTTAVSAITLQTYVDVVKAAIGTRQHVVLVGHSMAGLVISQVAEEIPLQIHKLVYLAAYLPKDGESLLSLATTDGDSHTGKYLKIEEAKGIGYIGKEGVTDVFAGDAPAEIASQIVAGFRSEEPLAPLATPVKLTEKNFGQVEKNYIHTVNDHAVSYALQKQMVKKTPVKKEYTLESSHTPFISMPKKLADIILEASR